MRAAAEGVACLRTFRRPLSLLCGCFLPPRLLTTPCATASQPACQDHDWSHHGSAALCDVGGGTGRFLATLLAHQPGMSGVLLDRWAHAYVNICIWACLCHAQRTAVRACPRGNKIGCTLPRPSCALAPPRRRPCVIKAAAALWAQQQPAAAARVQLVPGDFFAAVPPADM